MKSSRKVRFPVHPAGNGLSTHFMPGEKGLGRSLNRINWPRKADRSQTEEVLRGEKRRTEESTLLHEPHLACIQ